jgi:hypothetical protein
LGIDQPGRSPHVDGAEKGDGQDHPPVPPPDRPGKPGYPSRAESLRESREAALAAQPGQDRQPTGQREPGAVQRDGHQKHRVETFAAEPAEQEQDVQPESGDTEKSSKKDDDEQANAPLAEPTDKQRSVPGGKAAARDGRDQSNAPEPDIGGPQDVRPPAAAGRTINDTLHSKIRSGERGIDATEVIENADTLYYDENGNQIYVWLQDD